MFETKQGPMGPVRRAGAMTAFGLSMMVGFSAGGAVAGPVEEAVEAAMRDSEAGRCEEVARRFEAFPQLESRAMLLRGECRVRQQMYPEALADLDLARRLGGLSDAQVGDVELYRGVSLYHLERYQAASDALDDAESLSKDSAQLSLYRGLISLRQNDNERAGRALEEAARLGPAVTEPVASYYAGLAWRGADDRRKAREALARVVELDPDGPWGKEAAKLLESLDPYPFFARLQVGFEYDDNVLLRASGTDLSEDGDKDGRGVWRAQAGIQLYQTGPWTAGLLGSYAGSAHFELTDFDTHYPTVGAFLNHRLAPQTIARLRYDFGYAWVGRSGFLQSQVVQGSFSHTWERAGTTDLVGDLTWNDFRFRNFDQPGTAGAAGQPCVGSPPTQACSSDPSLNERQERDRDGFGIGAAIEHRVLVPLPPGLDAVFETLIARGGYRFGWYDSDGTEWEYFSHVLSAGFNVELPFDMSFDGDFAYEHYDFANPSTFPDAVVANEIYVLRPQDRVEDAFFVEAELEKDLTDQVSVSGRYTYYDNASNRRVYDYRRHVAGAYVNVRFE